MGKYAEGFDYDLFRLLYVRGLLLKPKMKQQSELKQLTLIKLYRMMFDENLSFRSTKVSRPIEEVKKILKDIDYSNIGDLIEYYTSNNGTTFFL